jgi:propanediol dehydratase small subunit
MKSIELFNGLNGMRATREELQAVIDAAKSENQVDIIYRTSKILNDYPKDQEFKIEVAEYPNTGLNAPRHVGIYK